MIYVAGASNPEVPALLAENGLKIGAFLDDRHNEMRVFRGHIVVGFSYPPPGAQVLNAVCGSTKARQAVAERLRSLALVPITFVPRTAVVRGTIGQGCFLQDGVIVQADAQVGRDSSIHANSVVAHETVLGEACFVAANVCINSRCYLGYRVYVGSGAQILPGLIIGDDATIGAGAVVTRNVAPGTTVVGNPARPLSKEPRLGILRTTGKGSGI